MTGCKLIVLSIDTATGPCSVAVWKDGQIRSYLENPELTRQSASLLPMVEASLKEASINYSDLTHVACTTGPGSFTGIRVGLAAARGICFSAGISALGFTTLETMAYVARDHAGDKPILSILNAGKGECYYQAFAAQPEWHSIYEAKVGTLDAALQSAPNAFIAGNMGNHSKDAITFPRADALATLAAERLARAMPLVPYYIREPDAKPMKVDS